MKPRQIFLAALFAVFTGALVLPVLAGEHGIAPQPVIDKSKGKCLAPPDQMRRNHMDFLLHQRDVTMYQGKRDKKNGLRACLECHAVNGEDGKPVSIKSEKHFCRTCHDFAAVKVDCWECHTSLPDKAAIGAKHPKGGEQ